MCFRHAFRLSLQIPMVSPRVGKCWKRTLPHAQSLASPRWCCDSLEEAVGRPRQHLAQKVHQLGTLAPTSLALATADTESRFLAAPHPSLATHKAPPLQSGVPSGVSIRNIGSVFLRTCGRLRVAARLACSDHDLTYLRPIPASFCSDARPSCNPGHFVEKRPASRGRHYLEHLKRHSYPGFGISTRLLRPSTHQLH